MPGASRGITFVSTTRVQKPFAFKHFSYARLITRGQAAMPSKQQTEK